jgi:hypothetical protein
MDSRIFANVANNISSGGTVNGSLTIDGDLTVNGDGSGNYDEIVDGNLAISSTNKLVLGGDGSDTYLQESGADVLDIYVGGANMIKLTESTTDTVTVTGALTIGSDGSGHDVTFHSGTSGDSFVWDASEELLTITGTNGQTALNIADGNLVVADNIDLEGDIDVNGTANLDIVDIDGAVDMASTLAVGDNVSISNATADKPVLQIENTNADNSSGTIKFVKNPTDSSEADADMLGGIYYYGNDDANNSTNYAFTRVKSTDVSNGSEDGEIDWAVMANGSMSYMTFKSGLLGVGTEDPERILHTKGAAEVQALFENPSTSSSQFAYVDIESNAGSSGEAILRLKTPDGTSYINSKGSATTMTFSSGSVGIGQTSPEGALHVEASDMVAYFTATETYSAGASGPKLLGQGKDSGGTERNLGYILFTSQGSDEGEIRFGVRDSGSVTDKMVVHNDGKIAIGASNADSLVQLSHATEPDIRLHRADTSISDGDSLGSIIWSGAGGESGVTAGRVGAKIKAEAADTWASDDEEKGTELQFFTQDDSASDTLGSPRMVINMDGNVGIGTSSPSSYDQNADDLVVYGSGSSGITIVSGTSGVGHIYFADGTTGNERYRGQIYYVHADDYLAFATAGGGATNFKLDANSRISLSNNDSGTSNTVFGKLAGASIDAGSNYNTFIGENVSDATMNDATYNIGIGFEALGGLTTGDSNTVVGSYAYTLASTGLNNVAIGHGAMNQVPAGQAVDGVVAVGFEALKGHSSNTTTGINGTVAIGDSALLSLTSGERNVAVGFETLKAEATGDRSTAVGYKALTAQTGTDGQANNTAIGHQAGLAITSGLRNTIIGSNVGTAFDAETDNIFIGQATAEGAINGADKCIIIGNSAFTGAATQDGTVGIGHQTLAALTSGPYNTAIGYDTCKTYTTKGYATAVGYKALELNNDDYNVAIGYLAGQGAGAGTFEQGVYIGANAGKVLTTGDQNVFIGYNAGDASTTNGLNVLVGANAGTALYGDLAGGNTFIGYNAGAAATTVGNAIAIGREAMGGGNVQGAGGGEASFTIAIGRESLNALTTGSSNLAIGYQSMAALTTGASNIAIGGNTLDAADGGETGNIAIGDSALGAMDEGSGNANYNIGIGHLALTGGAGNADMTGNIAIGANALNSTSTNSHTGTIAIGYETLTALTSGAGNTAVGYQAGDNLDAGNYNTILGYQALSAEDGHGYNVAVGYQALLVQNAGADVGNVAIGYQAGKAISTGARNLAIGKGAMDSLTVGDDNVAIGYDALGTMAATDNNDKNIAIGSYALANAGASSNVASDNVAIGYSAGVQVTTADNSTFIGSNAGAAITTGASNMAIGSAAMDAAQTSQDNIAIGAAAMGNINHANSNENVVIGNYAGDGMGTLDGNANNILIGQHCGGGTWTSSATSSVVAIGHYALDGALNNVDGTVAIGASALGALTTGEDNTAVGYTALAEHTTGAGNTAVGYASMDETGGHAGNYNTALGAGSMGGDWGGAADNNTAIGYQSLFGVMTAAGDSNTAVGYQAAKSITSAAECVLVGAKAGDALTSGTKNTALGANALSVATTALYNTAVGFNAMSDVQAGQAIDGCVAIGYEAMKGSGSTTTGANYSIAIGKTALKSITTAAACIGVGFEALIAHTTGANQIAIGHGAMDATGNAGGSANNLMIGTDAGGGTWGSTEQHHNIGIGHYAMRGALSGANHNIAIGNYSLDALVSGDRNVAIGYDALTAADGAESDNIAIGYNALETLNNDSSIKNIAIGSNALDAISTNVSNQNVAIGHDSGTAVTTADDCTMVGYRAGDALQTGSQNTLIGSDTDASATGGANQSVIGYGATGIADNSVTLGNASVDHVYAAQDGAAVIRAGGLGLGLGTTAPASLVEMRSDVPNIRIDSYNTTAGNASDIQLRRSNHGTLGTHTAVDADDALGKISFMGSDSNSFEVGAKIQGTAAETWVNGAEYGTYLTFHTTDIGTATLDERMRIDECWFSRHWRCDPKRSPKN